MRYIPNRSAAIFRRAAFAAVESNLTSFARGIIKDAGKFASFNDARIATRLKRRRGKNEENRD